MRFFQAVELAEWCYLSEAIAFLAFGKVPEVRWYDTPELGENGELVGHDYRFYWKNMPENFENNTWTFDWFDPEDFAAADIKLPSGYDAAAHSVHVGEISDAYLTIKFHEEHFHKFDFPEPERTEQLKKYLRAKDTIRDCGEQETLVEQTNSKFVAHLDKVWAQLFTRIHEGQVKVEALDLQRWEQLADAGDYLEAAEFVCIPPEAFRISHDYTQDEIVFGGKTYVATRTHTPDLLQMVEASFQPVACRSFGHSIVLDGQEANVQQHSTKRRPRGAPHALDWSKMERRLEEMIETDVMPQKKDACIHELIEFAEQNLGRRVGRTTVQTRLQRKLDAYYAQN